MFGVLVIALGVAAMWWWARKHPIEDKRDGGPTGTLAVPKDDLPPMPHNERMLRYVPEEWLDEEEGGGWNGAYRD